MAQNISISLSENGDETKLFQGYVFYQLSLVCSFLCIGYLSSTIPSFVHEVVGEWSVITLDAMGVSIAGCGRVKQQNLRGN